MIFSRSMQQRFEYILSAILPWYEQNARLLPWRDTPWSVLYLDFLKSCFNKPRFLVWSITTHVFERFPTLESLANAEWEDLLPVWKYNQLLPRGKNLLKTARISRTIWWEFSANEGRTSKAPGIGSYTSAAYLWLCVWKTRTSTRYKSSSNLQRFFGCTEKEFFPSESALWNGKWTCSTFESRIHGSWVRTVESSSTLRRMSAGTAMSFSLQGKKKNGNHPLLLLRSEKSLSVKQHCE